MTIKKKRAVVSALVALFATTAMAITASAETYTYKFSFHLDYAYQQYSAAAEKTNTRDYASVNVTSGNFLDGDRLYLRVCENYKADDYVNEFATETKWVNGPYDFDLDYYSGHGYRNHEYVLRGYQDGELYNLYASGRWQP